MKKLFLLLIFLLVPIVCASLEPKEYLENTEVDIQLPCVNNGSLCGGTCNVTIFYPNGSPVITNTPMTGNDGIYNYTLSSNYTSASGRHDMIVSCIDGSYSGTAYTYFNIRGRITATPLEGQRLTGIIIALIAVSAAFLIISHYAKLYWIKWFGYVVAFLQVMLILGIIWLNEIGTNISNILYIDFITLGIVAGGILVISLFTRESEVLADDSVTPKGWRGKGWD